MSFIPENNYNPQKSDMYHLMHNVSPLNSNKIAIKQNKLFNLTKAQAELEKVNTETNQPPNTIVNVQYIEPEDYLPKIVKKPSSMKAMDSKPLRHDRRSKKNRPLLSAPNIGIGLMAISPIYISSNPTAAALLFGNGLMTYAVGSSLEKMA